MAVTVDSFIVADVQVQGVQLQPLVGAFELQFGLYVRIAAARERACRARLDGARVLIRGADGRVQPLGFARSDVAILLQQGPYETAVGASLSLTLTAPQLEALEQRRDGGALDFELRAVGCGDGSGGVQAIQDCWHVHVAQSSWAATLTAARALDILILELSMPAAEPILSTGRRHLEHLRRAQRHFTIGQYDACVAACRDLLQGLAQFEAGDSAGAVLTRLSRETREEMSKQEREAGILAVLRHYTHLAHHPDGVAVAVSYSRPEAKFILSLAAAALNRTTGT